MILLSLDFETTGLNTSKDEVIEMGAVLYSTGQRKCLDSQGMLVQTNLPITAEITAITNCHPIAVQKFGYDQADMFDTMVNLMDSADHIISYNGRRFDRKIAEAWGARNNRTIPDKVWIDLYYDLPWQVPVGKLSHVAADHGILNLFPHSALADAQTVLAIAGKYDFDLLLARAKSPVVVLRSLADRSQNDVLKQAPWKFRWNPTQKFWWKPVKEQDVDEVVKAAPFQIAIEKAWTPEELEN